MNVDVCVSESKSSVEKAKAAVAEKKVAREGYYYPDLYGRDNCIYNDGYYDWMMDTVSALLSAQFLFIFAPTVGML